MNNNKATISAEEAINFFNEIKNDKSLAWNYPQDGCYARAHLAGEKATELGYSPQKAWCDSSIYYGDLETEFNIKEESNSNYSISKFEHGYHVALLLDVKDYDGKVKGLVFDPLIFDAPTTVAQWSGVLNSAEEHVRVRGFYESLNAGQSYYTPKKYHPDDCTALSKEILSKYLAIEFADVEKRKSSWLKFYNQKKNNQVMPPIINITKNTGR